MAAWTEIIYEVTNITKDKGQHVYQLSNNNTDHKYMRHDLLKIKSLFSTVTGKGSGSDGTITTSLVSAILTHIYIISLNTYILIFTYLVLDIETED